jgi:hypothetical protein
VNTLRKYLLAQVALLWLSSALTAAERPNILWELYDMEKDRTEMQDLASSNPRKARELAAKWEAWAEKTGVLPMGLWRIGNKQ